MALPKFPLSSLFLSSVCGLAQGRLSEYVDPLIGTEGSTPGSAIAVSAPMLQQVQMRGSPCFRVAIPFQVPPYQTQWQK